MDNSKDTISKRNPWQSLLNSLDLFSEDFIDNRKQPILQPRDELFE